jgi:hypothetical protein
VRYSRVPVIRASILNLLPANTTKLSRSKKSRNQDDEDDINEATHAAQRRVDVDDAEMEENIDQDGEEFSSQAISFVN